MILSLNKYDEPTKISGTSTILYDIDGDVAYFGEGHLDVAIHNTRVSGNI